MDRSDKVLAVDWGTTNRRGYLIDDKGAVQDEFRDDQGILALEQGQIAGEVESLRARFEDVPILLCGMIGSNKGWVETPYVPAPANLIDLSRGVQQPADNIWIVPGVSTRGKGTADVMRGEEVQLLGACSAGLTGEDALVCHPGTHNKWALVRDGCIIDFRTVMTGELFALLREHSILAPQLKTRAAPNASFRRGVQHALTHDDLTAALFSLRARAMLDLGEEDPASWASGLLIGMDVRIGLQWCEGCEGTIAVIGRQDLAKLYEAALQLARQECRCIDGEQSFIAGALALSRILL